MERTILDAAGMDVFHAGSGEGMSRFNAISHAVDLATAPDIEALVLALGCAFAIWPVLACRYDLSGNRARFVASGAKPRDLVRETEVAESEIAAQTERFIATPLSLHEEPPVRVLILRHPHGARLLVKIHHGVTDGSGGLELLRLLGSFAFEADRSPPVVSSVRSLTELVAGGGKPWRGLAWTMARDMVAQVRLMKAATADVPERKPKEGPPKIETVELALAEDETSQAMARAGGALGVNASINAACLVGMAHDLRRAGRMPARLGAMIVFNHRHRFSAAPRSIATLGGWSVVPVTRDELEAGFERTLAVVHDATMSLLDRPHAGMAPTLALELAVRVMPGALLRKAFYGEAPPVGLAQTMYLGNVERVLETFGEALRAYTPFGDSSVVGHPPIAAALTRGRLRFSSTYDARWYEREAVERFLERVRGLVCKGIDPDA